MFIRTHGKYARDDLWHVLGWKCRALPEDIAAVGSVELSFTAFNEDGRETYVARIEGRPPGIVLVPDEGRPIEDDAVTIKWIYPGVPGWGGQQ